MLNVKEHSQSVDEQAELVIDTVVSEDTRSSELSSKSDLEQFVDATAARDHIKALNDNGMTFRRMAELTGVSRSILGRIVYGRPADGAGPQERISAVNNAMILGLEFTPNPVDPPRKKTDATGTHRRIQALNALGFTDRIIYETSDISVDTFIAVKGAKQVRLGIANAIKMAYELLRDTTPPMNTPHERGLVSKTKERAALNKWHPPVAWDDATIDDPKRKPQKPTPQVEPKAPKPEIIRDCECKTVKHQHGTYGAYASDRCRCLPCREANRIVSSRNKRFKAYGRSNHKMVDAKPARKHVQSMMKRGWTVDQIAKQTGIGRATVSRLLYGEPVKNELPPEKILEITSDSILAFVPATSRNRYDGTPLERTDPTGTKRRIQALVACGYSMAYLSLEAGNNRQIVHNTLKSDIILLSTAETFKAIYDRLWDVEPPRSTPAEKKAYTTAKKIAQENGWPPPMAWDDDRIDDPNHKAVA